MPSDAWGALLASDFHASYQPASAGALACLATPPPVTAPAAPTAPRHCGSAAVRDGAQKAWGRAEAKRVLAGLHLLYEDSKLRGAQQLRPLRLLCEALAVALGHTAWAQHYRRDAGQSAPLAGGPSALEAIRSLRSLAGRSGDDEEGPVPCIRQHLLALVAGLDPMARQTQPPPPFPAVGDGGYSCGRTARVARVFRAFSAAAAVTAQSPPSAVAPSAAVRRKMILCVEAMAAEGLGPLEVAALPPGAALPLLQVPFARAPPPLETHQRLPRLTRSFPRAGPSHVPPEPSAGVVQSVLPAVRPSRPGADGGNGWRGLGDGGDGQRQQQ